MLEMQICEITLKIRLKSLKVNNIFLQNFALATEIDATLYMHKILLKSVQVFACYCKMLRGLLFC